jgi:hypothetical protein
MVFRSEALDPETIPKIREVTTIYSYNAIELGGDG